MRTILSTIAASLVVGLAPTSASPPNIGSAELAVWEANLLPCRRALAAAFSPARDEGFLDRFLDAQRLSPSDENLQRVLCTAYAHGAFDMADGRIVAIDPN
jgi:hypothetical protein